MVFVTNVHVERDTRHRSMRFSVLSAVRYGRMEAPRRFSSLTHKRENGFITLTIIEASFLFFICFLSASASLERRESKPERAIV